MKAIFFALISIGMVSLLVGCRNPNNPQNPTRTIMNEEHKTIRTATFAGGCFWCLESDLQKVNGVVDVISGYAGGDTKNPTYKEVSSGGTGHVEVVQVLYDTSLTVDCNIERSFSTTMTSKND
jgi:peptide methionine sulfoxide reductase msrA/msrB